MYSLVITLSGNIDSCFAAVGADVLCVCFLESSVSSESMLGHIVYGLLQLDGPVILLSPEGAVVASAPIHVIGSTEQEK